jgi:prepilin-type N-terminal cleavage/methylation domain-containing protein
MRKQISSGFTSPSAMRKQTSAGFTLLETLIVVTIIGIVSAIAVPSWLSFNQRQRVGTARNQIVQIIREAQDKARRTKTEYGVEFDPSDPRRLAARKYDKVTNQFSSNEPWQTLGNGDIKEGMLQLQVVYANNALFLLFSDKGTVKSPQSSDNDESLFKAIISVPDQPGTKQCVIVQTLLGGIREVNKDDQNQCS